MTTTREHSVLAGLALAGLLTACAGGPSAGDGGTSGQATGGASGGTTGTSGGTGGQPDAGPTPYCDGVELQNAAGADVYLLLYPLALDVQNDCATLVTLADAGPVFAATGSFAQAGGIWDAYAYASTEPFNGVYPGGCDDLGVGTGPSGGTFTPPDAGETVAAAVAAASDGGPSTATFFGVVTYVSPWTGDSSGSIYIQDPVAAGAQPAPHSGIDLYLTSGGANLPASAPARGDVVLVSNVQWSPYNGINQFVFGDSSALTTLGQASLPAAVPVTAAQLASGSTALDSWKGMRVVDVESFSIQSDCPTALQYTPH